MRLFPSFLFHYFCNLYLEKLPTCLFVMVFHHSHRKGTETTGYCIKFLNGTLKTSYDAIVIFSVEAFGQVQSACMHTVIVLHVLLYLRVGRTRFM